MKHTILIISLLFAGCAKGQDTAIPVSVNGIIGAWLMWGMMAFVIGYFGGYKSGKDDSKNKKQ